MGNKVSSYFLPGSAALVVATIGIMHLITSRTYTFACSPALGRWYTCNNAVGKSVVFDIALFVPLFTFFMYF